MFQCGWTAHIGLQEDGTIAEVLESPELLVCINTWLHPRERLALSLVSRTVRQSLKQAVTQLSLELPQHKDVSADQLSCFPSLRMLRLLFDRHHSSCSVNSLEQLSRLVAVQLDSYKSPSLRKVISQLTRGLQELYCTDVSVAELHGLELLTSLHTLHVDVTFMTLDIAQNAASHQLQLQSHYELWDSSSQALGALTGLRRLYVNCKDMDPRNHVLLSQLSQLLKLELLEVFGVSIPNQLGACQQLTELTAWNTFLLPLEMPAGLSGLQTLKLLSLPNVHHSSLHAVSALCNLTCLHIHGPEHPVNKHDLWYLRRLPVSLQHLSIDCRGWSLPGVSHLTQLTRLCISDLQGLQALVGLHSLQHLSFSFQKLKQRLPETYLQPMTQLQAVTKLEMYWANQRIDLEHLAVLPSLRILGLNTMHVKISMQSTWLRRLYKLRTWKCQTDPDTMQGCHCFDGAARTF